MKILIACDKMKGTFSSKQFGEMVENAIKTITPNVETEILQVSDGGDGFVEIAPLAQQLFALGVSEL